MDIDKTLTRVEELWFFDGGLVVQAEQSLYRISGGVLAARSPVFKDMLSFTQPPDVETIEGCPVVRLPDRAADVTCFFRAIFDSSFFESHPHKVAWADAISILHLSNKYSVEYLLRRALIHLSSWHVTTLSAYDAKTYGEASASLFPQNYDNEASYVALIEVARQVNALWMLPTAFYHMASSDEAYLDQILRCVMYAGRPAKLSPEDRILLLKSSLHVSRQGNIITSFLHSPGSIPGCEWGGKCTGKRLGTLGGVNSSLTEPDIADDPLNLLFPCDGLLSDCCPVCQDYSRKALREARQAVWDRLPGFCGLPSWGVLEKMKEKALED
ncbi:hypothetical protein B0H16DRAFT_1687266 [Mycena metata]|uniref:BTB domain-containing protein n=1 Tax=Mycena metata TaxID=1033252 RepID=A0AAD7JMJ9_9AGAR|nr:hypothetical protein B0H16DRAFT_1687266 [Mycena metata]